MPIAFACSCGQKYTVKDSMVGRAVKCPKCGQTLQVPAQPQALIPNPQASGQPQVPGQSQQGLTQAPAAPTSPGSQPATTPAVRQQLPVQSGPMDDLLEEIGMGTAGEGGAPCPSCHTPLKPNGVVCLNCGYNLQSGERPTMVREDTENQGPKDYDAVEVEKFGNDELDKAAINMARSVAESARVENVTAWWVYALGLAFLLGVMVIIYHTRPPTNLEEGEVATPGTVLGYRQGQAVALWIMLCGVTLSLIAAVQAAIAGFRDEVIHGVLCLVLFFIYPLIYTGIRWKWQSRTAVAAIVGLSLAVFGGILEGELRPDFDFSWIRFLLLVLTVFGTYFTFVGWAQIASHAYQNEESISPCTLCCVTSLLPLLNIYTIIYGFRRWSDLAQPVLLNLLGTIVLYTTWIMSLVLLSGAGAA